MDPWHRFRLLACIAGMLVVLGFGAYARLRWGVPPKPYGYSSYLFEIRPHGIDPFTRLSDYDFEQALTRLDAIDRNGRRASR